MATTRTVLTPFSAEFPSSNFPGLTTINARPVRLTAIKQWQAALTADEISAEMHSIRPLRLANLHSWHPAIANTLTRTQADSITDYSALRVEFTSA